MKKKTIWFVFLLALFISSYIREVLFRSVNALIEGERFFYAKTISIPFLFDWSPDQLIQLKYMMTAGFSLWFIALSLLGVRFSINAANAFKILFYFYAIAALTLSILFIISLLLSNFNLVYPYMRYIIGFLHGPLPYIFVSIGVIAIQQLK